jgi:hypothetical protein
MPAAKAPRKVIGKTIASLEGKQASTRLIFGFSAVSGYG